MMKSRADIVSIQYLRAIAASMVVCWHAQMMIPGFFKIFPAVVGNAGVDLFFCISGFVMVYVTAGRLRTAREFATARIIRIVPLYWFFTIGAAVMMFVAPKLYHSNELTFRHVTLSLLFVPHLTTSAAPTIQPLVKTGWTLIYEMFFYSFFAVAMVFSPKRRVLIAMVALLFVVVLQQVFAPGPVSQPQQDGTALFYLNYLGQPIVLEFVFGMIIAVVYLNKSKLTIHPAVAGAIIVAAFACMFAAEYVAPDLDRSIVWGVPSAAILVSCILLERGGYVPRWQFPRLVGDASYSLYLIHMFPLALLRWTWPRLHMPTESTFWGMIFIAIGILLAQGVGIFSYRLFERPATRWLKKVVDRLQQGSLTPAPALPAPTPGSGITRTADIGAYPEQQKRS